jgi:protein gp37
MAKSKISWTDAALNFLTWNCTSISPGCKHCYARKRARDVKGYNSAEYDFEAPPQWREAAVNELRLMKPGQVVFVNNHSDSFHEHVPLDWMRRTHTLIAQRPQLIFLLLTKRPDNALRVADHLKWPDNLWLGVSVEMPLYLKRMDVLRQIPAQHKFVSFEPLLRAIPSDDINWRGIEWNIVGGESGQGYRPFDKAWLAPFMWAREEQGIPLFFKQSAGEFPDMDWLYQGREYREFPVQFEALHERFKPMVSQPNLL